MAGDKPIQTTYEILGI